MYPQNDLIRVMSIEEKAILIVSTFLETAAKQSDMSKWRRNYFFLLKRNFGKFKLIKVQRIIVSTSSISLHVGKLLLENYQRLLYEQNLTFIRFQIGHYPKHVET